MTGHRGTRAQRLAREKLIQSLQYLQRDYAVGPAVRDEVPEAWHTLELDLDVEEPKEKITLYLDQSVARMFRAMGKGYQARINWLLRTWVQMKIAGELEIDRVLEARIADMAGEL